MGVLNEKMCKQNKRVQKKETISVKVKAIVDDFPALPTKKTKKNNQQTTFTATISFASIAGIVTPAKKNNENWKNLLKNTNTTCSSFDQDQDQDDQDDYDYQSDGSTFDKELLEEIYLTDDE